MNLFLKMYNVRPTIKRKSIIWLPILLLSSISYGQESLLLQDAIRIALEKNYDVQAASILEQQAVKLNTVGEAGLLPQVVLDAGMQKTNLSLEQSLSDGRTIENDGAASTLYNASVGLQWILFDGLAMFAKKGRLNSLSEEARLSLKLQMEITVQQVIAAYFMVRVEEENLKAVEALLQVDSLRVTFAELRIESGNGNKPALLQAKLEKHLHLAQQLTRLSALEEQRENLNILLGRDPSIFFTTPDSIVISDISLEKDLQSNDLRIKLANQQQQTSMQRLKESKGALWPTLTFVADYSFNRTENEAGFLLKNQNTGPGLGVNFRWALFDGFRNGNAIKHARLGLQLAEQNFSEAWLRRQEEERKQWRDFSRTKELLKLEEESKLMAEENLMIELERLKLGLSTSLEILEAQRYYQEAVSRLALARYQAKISEVGILRLNGKLIQ
ncbi:MAG: TolC family protein [Bacteroidetes bacterium]|nr:TolC family protein [Bacteroidota bacterium]